MTSADPPVDGDELRSSFSEDGEEHQSPLLNGEDLKERARDVEASGKVNVIQGMEWSSAEAISVEDGVELSSSGLCGERDPGSRVELGSPVAQVVTVENGSCSTMAQRNGVTDMVHGPLVAQEDRASVPVHGSPVAQGVRDSGLVHVEDGSPMVQRVRASDLVHGTENSTERKTRKTYESLPPISRLPLSSSVREKLIATGYTSLTSISLISSKDLARDVNISEAEAVEIWKMVNQIIGSARAEKSKMKEGTVLEPVRGLPERLEKEGVQHALSPDTSEKIALENQPKENAWSVPINFTTKGVSLVPSQNGAKTQDVDLSSHQMWPSLLDSQRGNLKKQQQTANPSKSFKEVTQAKILPVERKEDNFRFPWAARMDPTSRNLYRAAEPEFLEDGTPKVIIPKHVLLHGVENQKDYIVGQFYRCVPPPGGLIHAVFNKIWGRNCSITIKKFGESNYLFHIPEEATRKWVLQRGLWHVDDCLMFVASWVPQASLDIPEIKTVPIWVTLKNIPNILYSIPGISHIASGLGAPIATHKPRLDLFLMGEAKILVEVELSKAFPPRIAASDETGFISMVDVEYAWLPSKCARCGQLGHKEKRCLESTIEVDLGVDNVVNTSVSTLVNVAQPASPDVIIPNDVSPKKNIAYQASGTPKEVSSQPSPMTDKVINSLHTPANDNIRSDLAQHSVLPTSTIRKSLSTNNLSTNKFAVLESSESEDAAVDENDSEDSENDIPLVRVTHAGQRILRDRPVRPSTKVREQGQSIGGGRKNRGRGNRGRGIRGRSNIDGNN